MIQHLLCFINLICCCALISSLSSFSLATLMEIKQQRGSSVRFEDHTSSRKKQWRRRKRLKTRRRRLRTRWKRKRRSWRLTTRRRLTRRHTNNRSMCSPGGDVFLPFCGTLLKCPIVATPFVSAKEIFGGIRVLVNLLCSFLMPSFKPRIPARALSICK